MKYPGLAHLRRACQRHFGFDDQMGKDNSEPLSFREYVSIQSTTRMGLFEIFTQFLTANP